jgi:hypothetical protein
MVVHSKHIGIKRLVFDADQQNWLMGPLLWYSAPSAERDT